MSESDNVKVKQLVQNMSYFNKDTVFTLRKKKLLRIKCIIEYKAHLLSLTNISQDQNIFL